jgi:beta-glucosidase
VAVIGRDAAQARLGGYSGPGVRPVSILDGIRARLGAGAMLTYTPGPPRLDTDAVVVPPGSLASDSGPGLRGDYFDNIALSGAPEFSRTDRQVDFRWTFNSPGAGLTNDWYAVRWTGTITVSAGGARLGVDGSDGWRLWADGRLLIDDWTKRSSRRLMADQRLDPGPHQIRLEYFETTGNARVRLMWDAGVTPGWRAEIDSAVAAARASDVAIVVAGIEEGEFRDRALLGLPGHQADLVEAVAAAGKPVVVVLIGGSAITMPWLEHVGAVLDAWYPGEAGGEAVADILWGSVNPAGRLPITFPVSEGQLPLRYNHKPTGRGDDYLDQTGQPLFPFGFGLSYTTFDYRTLRITPDTIGANGTATVTCTIVNTGQRAGDEVVQLYIRDELASVARPVMELKGFQRVHLKPGDSVDVNFVVGRETLKMLDRQMRWTIEPGQFRIMVGASSRDIRLRGELTVR